MAEIATYAREWALDDIAIRSGGDGRTVEAYAAVFESPAEIHDQHGDYVEVIDRAAFNRTLSHGFDRVGVFYHHGMTLHGTPSDLGSVPIGRPLEVQADGKGLRTVTRYNKSQLADAVLESIRNGDIRGYSFRGGIYRSDPPARIGRRAPAGGLPTVRRLELGLKEYGPTPMEAYADARILAVRSADTVAQDLAALSEEERAELIRMLTVATPLGPADPETEPATPALSGPGAEDPPTIGHSGRLHVARARTRIALARMGAPRGKEEDGSRTRG